MNDIERRGKVEAALLQVGVGFWQYPATTRGMKSMTTQRIEPVIGQVQIHELRLNYVDWGEAGRRPMVLLHGFSAQARYWDGFAVHMRDSYHVYALDQRGHGDSDWAADYGPDRMPADLAAFVDQLGLDRFTIVGHSMGGGVAFRYTADHPDRVERLIIEDSGLPSPERPPVINPDNSVQRSLAKDTFEDEDAVVAHLMRQSPGVGEERLRQVIPQWYRRLEDGRYTFKFDPALRQRLRGAAQDPEEYRRSVTDLRDKLTAFAGPVLLVRGGESDILSPEAAEETVAAFRDATLVTIPDAGHNVHTDNPRAFRAAVRDWLGLPA
jgi:pimeloyl-ACP methyl ester carboxylesterase